MEPITMGLLWVAGKVLLPAVGKEVGGAIDNSIQRKKETEAKRLGCTVENLKETKAALREKEKLAQRANQLGCRVEEIPEFEARLARRQEFERAWAEKKRQEEAAKFRKEQAEKEQFIQEMEDNWQNR